MEDISVLLSRPSSAASYSSRSTRQTALARLEQLEAGNFAPAPPPRQHEDEDHRPSQKNAAHEPEPAPHPTTDDADQPDGEDEEDDRLTNVTGLSAHSILRRLDKRRRTEQPPQDRRATRGSEKDKANSNDDDDDDDDQSNGGHSVEHVICALIAQGKRIGCAYLDVASSSLFVMDDYSNLTPDEVLDVVSTLNLQIQPTVVLSTAPMDNSIMAIFTKDETRSGKGREVKVDLRPSSEFSLNRAKGLVANTYLPPSIASARKEDRLLYISSIVRNDNNESVKCAGAILTHIRTGQYGYELEDPEKPLNITLHPLHVQQYMYLSSNTFRALQIFESNTNPNTHSERSKEGLSVFGIINLGKTKGGRRLLRTWFLRPEQRIDVINKRQNAVEYFSDTQNMNLVSDLCSSIKHVHYMPSIIARLNSGRATVNDWHSLFLCGFHSYNLAKTLRDDPGCAKLHAVKVLVDCVDHRVYELTSLLNKIIDFDESSLSKRFVVKPHVDVQLDELKRTYHGLDDFLSKVALEIRKSIPVTFATSLNVVYWPQLGYLVALPLRENMRTEQDFQLPGFRFQFCTKTMVYYRCDKTLELDHHLGDLHGLIVDREIDIMWQLQEKVLLQYADLLLQIATHCSELDCLLALAEAARRYNYSRPVVVQDNVIQIKKGRHPLQELCVDAFIPNDADFSATERVFLVTGANYSGKSVYLKQVALIVYLAHVGSFVPAAEAVIGVTDKILTRIWTQESVSSSASTFMADLQQMSFALNHFTSRSLIVIDEFGKGTNADDGIGLLTAALKRFDKPPSRDLSPKVIACTHFHEIIENRFLEGSSVQLQTMEILKQDDDEMVFLYNLKKGYATNSWGSHCATIAGIPEPIVRRGTLVTTSLACRERIAPLLDDVQERQRHLARCRLILTLKRLDCENGNLDGFRHLLLQTAAILLPADPSPSAPGTSSAGAANPTGSAASASEVAATSNDNGDSASVTTARRVRIAEV